MHTHAQICHVLLCPTLHLQITSLKVDAIIRGGLQRFTDMIGQLWVSLGDYYIRAGHFEKARDVYEEAMATVTTVRDFGQVRHRWIVGLVCVWVGVWVCGCVGVWVWVGGCGWVWVWVRR